MIRSSIGGIRRFARIKSGGSILGRRDNWDAAIHGGHFDGIGEHHAAGVEDNLRAAICRGFAAWNPPHWPALELSGVIRAPVRPPARPRHIGVGAAPRQSPCAAGFGDLDGRGTDSRLPAPDDDGRIAGACSPAAVTIADHAVTKVTPKTAPASSMEKCGGFKVTASRRNQDRVGMRAVAGKAQIAAGAKDFASDEVLRPCGDCNGHDEIPAWDSRQRGAVHDAGDIFYVAGINGGGV